MSRRSRGFAVLAAFLVSLLVLSLAGCKDEPAPELQTLSMVIDCEANRKDEAEAVAADLRKIGIQAEARTWEWSALKAEFMEGNRQLYMTDWGSSYFDPFDLVIPKLKTGDRGNYSHYSNSELDSLLDQVTTTTDEESRRDLYHRVQNILYEDAPWVFGYCLQETGAASKSVGNWKVAMDSRINLHDVTLDDGDTITVGMGTDKFITLDPGNYRDRDTETLIRNIFDALVTRTHEGEVVAEIAESWEIPDPTTYVFKIRDGVKFHNGEVLTADDVVFTFDRVLKENGIGGNTSPRQGLLGPLKEVRKVDESTVEFVLENPFPVFLQALCHFQIVPKAYVEEVGDEVFAEKPIGTGPFKFKEGRLDDQVVLERFDDYYGGSPDLPPVGPAAIKTAIFRLMPDPATRVAALKAGEVHIIDKLPPDIAEVLKSDQNVTVDSVPGTRVYAIEICNTKPPFDDVRVRKALNYAIDWDSILSSIYGGYGERVSTALIPSGFGYSENLEPYPYDPAKAVELLQEAGIQASLPK
jgi:peptide/nickel transport system substrate-binding protein